MHKHWDIFCKIIDNFGDIGVCWRLARQLQAEHALQVRLWIDDPVVAKQLIPSLNINLQTQVIQNISIDRWHADTVFNESAEVVIELFSGGLPAAYLSKMRPNTVWINLEYLSAETWVDSFHAGNSKRGDLTRYFFFPGFTPATGGLLREHDIVTNNQLLASSKPLQHQFLDQLNLEQHNRDHSNRLKISLFCYPHAPIHALLSAMANANQPTDCYVPASSILPIIAGFFGKNSIVAGEVLTHQNLNLYVLPFLSQADYDKLLAICDVNFVRGEDSWVRAIWAGKPFVWQPYLQTEQTHITKLKAFLALFYNKFDDINRQSTYDVHLAWVGNDISTGIWQDYLNNLATLKPLTLQQSHALATQADLATELVIFSEKSSKKS
ncbi:MAG: elongation factor P maturation arginine rhamnosyltransferase EarP [Methylotenera sp.]|nr:elongation factor P maturation arginine rhamnosyltransferase EarP [Methylotenera sp.]MDP1958875.1 elongation factor P maturation arginine rhamnosyltransferase EarP [Methylotenera sp.]MDP3943464.1 elongation factor P maturation arginine rhamnosyltransferase EarP [Methylotenera sp.]